jgi:hypothetical protein
MSSATTSSATTTVESLNWDDETLSPTTTPTPTLTPSSMSPIWDTEPASPTWDVDVPIVAAISTSSAAAVDPTDRAADGTAVIPPLTLAAQPCVLDGLTLIEPVDILTLELLIHSDLLECKLKIDGTCWNEPLMLRKYRKKASCNRVHVTYRKTANNPFGRCNAEGAIGMHMLRIPVRNRIANNRYVDIDMKNAQ